MAYKSTFDVFLAALQKRIDYYSEGIIEGAVDDYAAYREKCGIVQGLKIAHVELEELSIRLGLDDEEEGR